MYHYNVQGYYIMMDEPASHQTPFCHHFIAVYERIKLPASPLEVETRLYYLLSLLPFIHVRQFTVISLQPGAEAWVPVQVKDTFSKLPTDTQIKPQSQPNCNQVRLVERKASYDYNNSKSSYVVFQIVTVVVTFKSSLVTDICEQGLHFVVESLVIVVLIASIIA